jgi:TolB-like protein/tetratricopeptide (TPR) repeat protein
MRSRARRVSDLLRRFRERKLVQWGLAYLAGAWLLLQFLHLLADTYAWPPALMRAVPILLATGLLAALVLAWYHGEKGHQRMSGTELVLLTTVTVAGLMGAFAVAAAGGGAVAVPPEEPIDPHSVAVLPSSDSGQDPADDYFSDGMIEEIIDALARVPGLRVSARTSSFYYKGRDLPIRQIARELRVAAVLETTVRRDGERVRISARLIDAGDRQLWSQSFDRTTADAIGVQSEIAATVARELQARMSPGGSATDITPLPGAAAHDLFLQGLFNWNRRSRLHVRRAIDLFEEAIRLEPDYARAHAGLALAWVVAHHNAPDVSATEALARAEAAARRALEFDPRLAEAYTALGYTYYWMWRWDDALEALERAVVLNPNSSAARQWYGEQLAQLGRSAEAEAQLRQAVALDPMSLVAHGNLGLVLHINGRTRDAIAQLEATERMDPAFAFPLLLLHRLYLLEGRLDDALRVGRRWAEVTGSADPADVVTLVGGIADPTRRDAAHSVLDRWEAWAIPNWVDIAYYRLQLGDHDRAIGALERALDERAPFLALISVANFWDPLRGDPRFHRVWTALDLPPEAARHVPSQAGRE